MKKALLIVILMILSFAVYGEMIRIAENSNKKLFNIVSDNDSEIEIEFSLDKYESEKIIENGFEYEKISYINEGDFLEIGKPDLPRFSRLLTIPDDGNVSVDILSYDDEILTGMNIYPRQKLQIESLPPDRNFVIDTGFYSDGDIFPGKIIEIGDPLILRDQRVVNLTINPFQYDPVTKELRIIKNLSVNLTCSGRSGENPKLSKRKKSRSFESFYRSVILNYENDRDEDYQIPSYLFIYPSNLEGNQDFADLIEWKHQKGFEVNIASTTETGSNQNSIKNYIQDAYDNWENPPEFICLVGDAGGSFSIPTWTETWSGYSGEGDNPYTLLEGNDNISDVFLGRLSFNSLLQFQTIVYKILYYEKEPYLAETDWYTDALLAGDPSISGPSCVITKKNIKEMMLISDPEYTFDEVYNGNFVTQMSASLNDGVSYMNYRGWLGMSDWTNTHTNALTNGHKLPIAVVITCGTGGFQGTSDCRSEAFLKAGTPGSPKGAVASIGTATSGTHTCFNNSMDLGIFYGIFIDNIYHMGGALNRGKLNLLQSYPSNPHNKVDIFAHWNNLMGDPGMDIWTKQPQNLIANYSSEIPLGSNYLEVSVKDGISHQGLEGVWITALKGDDEIFVSDITDASGKVFLPVYSETEGEVTLTITKPNYIPHLGSFNIIQSDIFINVDEYNIDDDLSGTSNGNDDGMINPGEDIELGLSLKNFGLSNANSITASITSETDFITITDAEEEYGTIEAGNSIFCADDFDFTVDPSVLGGSEIILDILITANDRTEWQDKVYLTIDGAVIEADNYVIDDNENGILEPGETAELIITLKNSGTVDCSDLTGILSGTSGLSVNDPEGSFAFVPVGEESSNDSDRFEISASNNLLPGAQLFLNLHLSNNDGYDNIVSFMITVGEVLYTDPLGPDNYGYYCYDDGDSSYEFAPTYNWIEIDPTYGGDGTTLNLNDSGNTGAILDVDLPFTFRFYGIDYDEITVCSNGWIAPGTSEQYAFMNWHIPGAGGPSPMIAPFWDDLMTSGGHICYYYDPVENYFIVEWSHLHNEYNNNEETFQLILFDPLYHQTLTGDGDILFQYETVNNVDQGSYVNYPIGHGQYATIGIEDHSALIGLEFTYDNDYPDAAKHLEDEMAILFTTNKPAMLFVDQNSFNTDIGLNQEITDSLLIANTGTGELIFEIETVEHNGWLSFDPESDTLQTGMSSNIELTFSSYGMETGGYLCNILITDDSENETFIPVSMMISDTEAGENAVFEQTILRGNYPNPFYSSTSISFSLNAKDAKNAKIEIYNIRGQKIKSFQNLQISKSSNQQIVWDGKDETGKVVNSGIYFYKLDAGDYAKTRRMIMMK